jgi:hypothetical protein
MKLSYFGCCVVFSIHSSGYTQKKRCGTADKKFDNYSYVDAIAT